MSTHHEGKPLKGFPSHIRTFCFFFYRKRNHDIDIQLSPKGVSMIKITFRKDISTERYVAITWQYVEKIDITEKPDYGNDTIISTFSSDEVPSPFYQSPTQYYLDVEDHKLRRSLAAFSFRSDEELGVVIVDWENITNRPAQYPPTAHHHSFLDIDDTSPYIVTPGQFNEHVSDKDNPHEVTITQIGAAAANHTHTLKALGAAATNHNHDTVYSKLTHDHDAVYSKLNHTHTPASIGAANVKHTHFLDDIQDIQTIYDLIDSVTGGNAQLSTDFYAFRTEAREQMKENKDNLAAHIADKDNPHEVTKTQVGLSLVYNGSMATQAEAADATNTTTYLNPKAGSALIDSKLATVGTEINRVTPTYIATLTLDNTSNLTDRIMIYPNRIYMIVFSSKHITNLKNVSMFLSGEDVATTVRNSIFLTQTLTVGSSSVETLVRHTYTSEMYEFVAPDTGVTSASGTLFFDTSSYLLSGILGGIVQNESGTEITSVNYPMVYSSSLTVDSTPENAEYLVFEINSSQVSTKASFTIFEIAKWNEEPALMVDATPVGTIVSRPLDAYAPGYSLLDGSELSRENNPELFTFAETNNLIKSQTEYDTAVTTNGYCEYFGSGDGTSTFTIPTAKTDSSSIYKQYMKIKKLTIPGEQEVLYRFTWLDE